MSAHAWIRSVVMGVLLCLGDQAQGAERTPTKARRPTLWKQGEAALASKNLTAARTALEGAFRQAPSTLR